MKAHKNFLFIALIFCFPSQIFSLSYQYLDYGYFTSVHILTVDPNQNPITPVRASGDEVKRETVASIAKKYGALAAVNGGFWKLDGRPAGILKINNEWHGTPIKPRGAIGWSEGGKKVLIDRVLTSVSLNEIEVIPQTNLTIPEEWKELENIVGGAPVLISNGKIIKDFSPEQTLSSFLNKKHSRTAVGINKKGEWIFVVVDSRVKGFLGGMTIEKLAKFMQRLDCIEALNLDGGKSSTLVIEGAIINDPHGELLENGKNVQAVSDAILIN